MEVWQEGTISSSGALVWEERRDRERGEGSGEVGEGGGILDYRLGIEYGYPQNSTTSDKKACFMKTDSATYCVPPSPI